MAKLTFFAVANPAAGGGRCGRLIDDALKRVRDTHVELEVGRTSRAGEASELARRAYGNGFRNFIAAGGDGTAFEVLNGLFPQALTCGRVSLAILPLGTGNSFLKDFTARGFENTIEAIKDCRRRACDIIRLRHAEDELYLLNLVSLGFPAEVGAVTNRRFKKLGELGYIFGVFARLIRLNHQAFPHRLDGASEWNDGPCLFLAFSNSKFTGGKMMIAPKADPTDGQIEYVRWSPLGRLALIRNLPRLFTGTHIDHPLASRGPAQRIDFRLDRPVNVLVDGEILYLHCHSLEVIPAALDVFV